VFPRTRIESRCKLAVAREMRAYLPAVTRSAHGEPRGLALIVASTLAYGTLPILGKLAYAAGVLPLPLLAWRYALAASLIALLERGPRLPLRQRLRLWGLGSIFVFNSIAYFRALETVPASVVSLVLYTYPVIVALLAAVSGLERLRARGLLGALAAFGGCALTAGFAPAGEPLSRAGVGWALLAALIYASYIVLSSRLGAGVQARVLALHLAQAAAAICALFALAGPGLWLPASPRAWLTVAAIGVVPTVVAMTTFLAGMALVGPTRASVLSSLEVIVTLVLAFALLGDRLSAPQWAGAALILGAVAWQNLGALRAVGARRDA
jgi:drug/metabolite transporter (DMT)-like permease